LTALLALSFHVSTAWAGYLVTATQFGYVLGILFLVPLSDILNRRKLLTALLVTNVGALLLAAASTSFLIFTIASFLMGIAASAVMVVTAMVALYAPEQRRGRMLGHMMTGLLIGVLLARTVSGCIAYFSNGWRAVYVLAALAAVVLLFGLRAIIQDEVPRSQMRYGALLASLVEIVRSQPLLRQRSLLAAFGLGTFSLFWTGLTFLLSGAPYHYSELQIGMFGLLGAGAALAAGATGRVNDSGYTRQATWALMGLLMVAWLCIGFGGHSLTLLIIGTLLVDVGVTGLQITHQSVIYTLPPQSRARVTTVFIASGFIGATVGSALASASFAAGGWLGLCAAGIALPSTMLVIWARICWRRAHIGAASSQG